METNSREFFSFVRNVRKYKMPKLKKKSVAQKMRKEEENRLHDTNARRLVRQNQARRQEEQLADTASRRLARQDPARRHQKQLADIEYRRLARKDIGYRSVERKKFWEAEKKRRQTAKSSYEKLVEKYSDQIRQSPSYICSCCGGLWYEKSTTITSQEELIRCGCSQDFIDTVLRVHQNQHRFCGTCKRNIAQKQIPRLCLSNGFDFPIVPSEIKVNFN
jgi:rubrerythrin